MEKRENEPLLNLRLQDGAHRGLGFERLRERGPEEAAQEVNQNLERLSCAAPCLAMPSVAGPSALAPGGVAGLAGNSGTISVTATHWSLKWTGQGGQVWF